MGNSGATRAEAYTAVRGEHGLATRNRSATWLGLHRSAGSLATGQRAPSERPRPKTGSVPKGPGWLVPESPHLGPPGAEEHVQDFAYRPLRAVGTLHEPQARPLRMFVLERCQFTS